jgi:hypothetical protein
MTVELTKRFATETTTLGEPIHVVGLDKSDGVVERDEGFMQQVQEAAIKEYFFGDALRTLSPFTQQIDWDSLVIYQSDPDCLCNLLLVEIYTELLLIIMTQMALTQLLLVPTLHR